MATITKSITPEVNVDAYKDKLHKHLNSFRVLHAMMGETQKCASLNHDWYI